MLIIFIQEDVVQNLKKHSCTLRSPTNNTDFTVTVKLMIFLGYITCC